MSCPLLLGGGGGGSGALRLRPEIKKKLQSQAGGTPTLTYPALVRTAPLCPRLRRAFVSNFCEIPPPSFLFFSSFLLLLPSPPPLPLQHLPRSTNSQTFLQNGDSGSWKRKSCDFQKPTPPTCRPIMQLTYKAKEEEEEGQGGGKEAGKSQRGGGGGE